MKRFLSLLTGCILMFSITACNLPNNNIDNIEIIIGKSTKFTEKEIEQAIHVVIQDFFKDSEHIELHSLSYNEEYSDSNMINYRENVDLNNMIIISSDFYVDSKAGGAWNPDSDYSWMFILSRDNKDSDWNLDDWGY